MGILLSVIISMFLNGNLKSDYRLYAETGIIVETDAKQDLVTVECVNGNLFSFYGIEDYEEGDLVGMLMSNNGTGTVYDDVILSTNYVGSVEQFDRITKGR